MRLATIFGGCRDDRRARVVTRSIWLFALLLVSRSTAACTSEDAPRSTCEPGATRVCSGPGACTGAQACVDNGSKWGACACGGGVGGSGGTPSSGGAAGVGGTTDAGGAGGAGPQCPTTKPTEGALCYGWPVCTYGTDQCACDSLSWRCGSCGTSPPKDYDACDASGLKWCVYPGVGCYCDHGAWHCNACPGEPPSLPAGCAVYPDVICQYPSVACFCGADESWYCD